MKNVFSVHKNKNASLLSNDHQSRDTYHEKSICTIRISWHISDIVFCHVLDLHRQLYDTTVWILYNFKKGMLNSLSH